MKKSIMFSLVTLAAIFVGCGGGGGDSTTTGYLIDSAVSGASYSCGEKSGVTNGQGMFSCKILPVTFSIGKIQLGSISTLPSDGKIYPQDLAGVVRTDFDSAKVKKLAQLFQSLDTDHNASNGIAIDATLATKLDADIADWNSLNMEEYLYNTDANIQVVSTDNAMKHLKEQFTTRPTNGGGTSGGSGGSSGENLINTIDVEHMTGYTLKSDDPTNMTDHYKTRYYIFKEGNKVTIVEDLDDGDQVVHETTYDLSKDIKGVKNAYDLELNYVNKAGVSSSFVLLLTNDYHFKQISPKLPLTVMPNDKNGVVIKNNGSKPESDNSIITVKSASDLIGYTITSNEKLSGSGTFATHQTIEFKVKCDGTYKETIDTHLAGQAGTPTVNEGNNEEISVDENEVSIGSDSIYLDSNQQIIIGKNCIDADGKLGAECSQGLYVKTIKKDACN